MFTVALSFLPHPSLTLNSYCWFPKHVGVLQQLRLVSVDRDDLAASAQDSAVAQPKVTHRTCTDGQKDEPTSQFSETVLCISHKTSETSKSTSGPIVKTKMLHFNCKFDIQKTKNGHGLSEKLKLFYLSQNNASKGINKHYLFICSEFL